MNKRRNTTFGQDIAQKHSAEREPILVPAAHARRVFEGRMNGIERIERMDEKMSKYLSRTLLDSIVASGSFEIPGEVSYEELAKLNKPWRQGTYTLNPDKFEGSIIDKTREVHTLGREYFKSRGLIGEPVATVLQHIYDNFIEEYYFPDIEDAWACVEAGNKLASPLISSVKKNIYICPGSHFSLGKGEKNGVPTYMLDRLQFKEVIFSHVSIWAENWHADNVVVLIKRPDTTVQS